MKRAKDATLVVCLFIVYCVLLSQGLKASAVSAFFGALAAVPLTVHLYRRLYCAAESGINRIVAMRAPPGPVILPGSTGRCEALPPKRNSPGKRITPDERQY